MPFKDTTERALHFAKHGHEFGAADEVAYEQLADAFMFGDMNGTTQQCARTSGKRDRLRLDFVVVHFGVAGTDSAPEFIRTFYIVRSHLIASHGGTAGFFAYECGRVNL